MTKTCPRKVARPGEGGVGEAVRSEAVKLSKIKNIVLLVKGHILNVAEKGKKLSWSYKGGRGKQVSFRK